MRSTHGIGENGSFNNENMCMAKLLFYGVPDFWEMLRYQNEYRRKDKSLNQSWSAPFLLLFVLIFVPFCKIRIKVWKKIYLICAHNTNNNNKTNKYINKPTNSDDFTLHLYMSCYTHHVPMRWLKYVWDYDWERDKETRWRGLMPGKSERDREN